MACDDLCWTDSQIDTCDDLYKKQQQAVTYRSTESKAITYKEPGASSTYKETWSTKPSNSAPVDSH